jgi:hypothetical protein
MGTLGAARENSGVGLAARPPGGAERGLGRPPVNKYKIFPKTTELFQAKQEFKCQLMLI